MAKIYFSFEKLRPNGVAYVDPTDLTHELWADTIRRPIVEKGVTYSHKRVVIRMSDQVFTVPPKKRPSNETAACCPTDLVKPRVCTFELSGPDGQDDDVDVINSMIDNLVILREYIASGRPIPFDLTTLVAHQEPVVP